MYHLIILGTLYIGLFTSSDVQVAAASPAATNAPPGVQPTVSLTHALLLILGFGVFAALVALAFDLVRRYVFHDADNLDTAFDAGGKVTIGLTATTIVSQWTWAATLLQSSTVAAKYGISGPFWYASGATIQIILFAILSIQLKTRAPGAKTFLQVVRARFGNRVHLVFVVFALFTNLVVTASLMLGGTAVLTSLIQGLSLELAVLILAFVIGTYTLIGGLGATFYVSYFNTTLIFIMLMILVIEVYHNPTGHSSNPFGSSDNVYHYLNQTIGPVENVEGSYLTFLSKGGLMFGVINIIGNFGTVFCDQSYWQSSVAAKPIHGVWGFISGGLTWFAIPFTMATTMGLAYLAFGAVNGGDLLTLDDINAGLVPPVVAQSLLGRTGEFVILLLILMAVMSTGSAEVIAVSSIIIYDIYKIHVKPYRKGISWDECENCGLPNEATVNFTHRDGDVCTCCAIEVCKECMEDNIVRKEAKHVLAPHYSCEVHGRYREYMGLLLHYKNWCIVWVTAFIIPLVLICKVIGLNLSWVYLFTGVLIGCSVIPISLSVLWIRVNGKGMVSGVVIGCICGISTWLGKASTLPGGLGPFIQNTGTVESMLVGNCVSIGVGGLVCIVVSLITNREKTQLLQIEWEKTRNIDNPLKPWTTIYAEDFGLDKGSKDVRRPLMSDIMKLFRVPRMIAYSVGITLSVLLIIVWPCVMIAVRVMGPYSFGHWVRFSETWAFAAAIFIILVPLIQEIYSIYSQVKLNKAEEKSKQNLDASPKRTKEDFRETHAHQNPAFDGYAEPAANQLPGHASLGCNSNGPSVNSHAISRRALDSTQI